MAALALAGVAAAPVAATCSIDIVARRQYATLAVQVRLKMRKGPVVIVRAGKSNINMYSTVLCWATSIHCFPVYRSVLDVLEDTRMELCGPLIRTESANAELDGRADQSDEGMHERRGKPKRTTSIISAGSAMLLVPK